MRIERLYACSNAAPNPITHKSLEARKAIEIKPSSVIFPVESYSNEFIHKTKFELIIYFRLNYIQWAKIKNANMKTHNK